MWEPRGLHLWDIRCRLAGPRPFKAFHLARRQYSSKWLDFHDVRYGIVCGTRLKLQMRQHYKSPSCFFSFCICLTVSWPVMLRPIENV